ncbi:MAG TPA: hypothetical protein VHU87_15420 [Rhizomicrobium sp.]|jgi:hypothetical protein|nr:hypothetical protein [Rhizomicrobium sp.]
MKFRAPLAVLLLLPLSGCVIFGGPADKALRRTPSYRDGYQDGCAAANDAYSNFRKGPLTDNALYRTDQVYRSGWGNGFQACRTTLTPGVQANSPDHGPLPDEGPGHQ